MRASWYAFWHFLSRCAAILLFDYRYYPLGFPPETGGFILASNHQSFLDPWLVGLCQRRQLTFLARDTLFRFAPFGWFIGSVNALPVARESSAPRQGIETCLRTLAAGRGLVLFPEGTRTRDGRLGPLKRGISLIARQSGVPVVPVWVDGAFEAWPRDRVLPDLGRPVRVVIGAPLAPPEGRGEGKKPVDSGRVPVESVHDRWAPGSESEADSPGSGTGTITAPGDTSGCDVPPEEGARPPSSRSSATFLEDLGEAYRVLQEEARKRRQSRF